jgi:hypothetical protein
MEKLQKGFDWNLVWNSYRKVLIGVWYGKTTERF